MKFLNKNLLLRIFAKLIIFYTHFFAYILTHIVAIKNGFFYEDIVSEIWHLNSINKICNKR